MSARARAIARDIADETRAARAMERAAARHARTVERAVRKICRARSLLDEASVTLTEAGLLHGFAYGAWLDLASNRASDALRRLRDDWPVEVTRGIGEEGDISDTCNR